ncbi:hypothetical protein Acsp06_62780 [Actinomycetospora sp. NBRC 106375]|nr:hypothetical protein Acsp06_62780 [Actinomycetospora sp. NBRC 106375]
MHRPPTNFTSGLHELGHGPDGLLDGDDDAGHRGRAMHNICVQDMLTAAWTCLPASIIHRRGPSEIGCGVT